MLAIFNDYDHLTRELMQSLRTAGIDITPLVVRYQGELPDGALCPFTTYTGLARTGSPLFFNQVPVPAWCEIRQEREAYGVILRDGSALGRIHYEANSFRQVESVDWLLADRGPSHTDHYDRYGNRYATTYYSAGVAYQTVYRGPTPCQIEVNHVSRAVVMRSPEGVATFATLTDFLSHFIDDLGLADDRVLINSLSYPLFVMRRRASRAAGGRGRATLFWQEPMPAGIPGNMATELEHPVALERIVFNDHRHQERVAATYPGTPVELAYLSHLGQFAPHHNYDARRAFTLTNTDDLPGLVELLETFPEVTFSVAALTLMSEKLHALERTYPNLVLTPTINHTGIREELSRASVYLDINAGEQVLDVVAAAYYLDLVVLALAPYAKAPDHSQRFATIGELAAYLRGAVASPQGRETALYELHTQRGPLSSEDDYRRLLA